ncbi:MAG: oxidoreductase [Luteibacter jiangsuensis]
MKTWFVTGASRGLGFEICRAALDAGHRVVATARDAGKIADALAIPDGRLLTLALDVTDSASIDAAVAAARKRFGRIDVLVNNAGYGQLGAFEEVSRGSIAQQFATNVFGVFDVSRAVLPLMRAQRAGYVITISSVAGMTGFEGASIYCATKHAVSGWSDSLAQEVAPFGIKVTCVYPGRFRTDFLDASSVRHGEIAVDDYAALSEQRRAMLDAGNHRQSGDPVRFAQAILELASMQDPPQWLASGSDAYALFTERAKALRDNAEDWKALATSTDFPESAGGE